MPGHIKKTVKLVTILILLIVGLLLEYHYKISDYFGPDQINQWLARSGDAAPLVFIGVMASAIVISPIPTLPLDIAAGSFFGPLLGTLYAATGALIGAVASFLIARFLGRDLIKGLLGGHINFCSQCSDQLLIKMVFFSRLIPVISFDIVSYGAGFTAMSLWKFVLATFFGMLPLTFIYVSFGAVVIDNTWLAVVLGLGVVLLFFLLPRWIERNDIFSWRKYFHHLENSNDES